MLVSGVETEYAIQAQPMDEVVDDDSGDDGVGEIQMKNKKILEKQ